MTRTFWVILTLIVLGLGGFASMLSFGHGEGSRTIWRRTPVAVATPDAQGLLAVPVFGIPRGAIRNSWGEARGGGARGHHGTDIMAPGGAKVIAAAPGRIEKLFQSNLGGTTLYVRSPDGAWTYYYAHLAGYAPGVHEGQVVKTGDPLGFVGDTGDAGPGNYHLHFGLSRMAPGEHWWQGQDENPFPLLAGNDAHR